MTPEGRPNSDPKLRTSTFKRQTNPRVIIVGGGLAGMGTAVALESAGARVTLLEARRRLGGRAGSFEDPQSGEELDNCQHVLLGCCTNLIDFYGRLDVLDQIHFEPNVHFVDPTGTRYDLSGVPGVPAPLHLAPALLRFNLLNWPERIALLRAMTAMLHMGRSGRLALADVPFGEWLDRHRQPAGLIRKLYEPLLVGSLNEQVRPASSSYAIQVFQDALLAHSGGYRVGLPGCPLSQLYAKLPCSDVRLGVRVTTLRYEEDRVAGVETPTGEYLEADAVVLATNHHTLEKWVPAEHSSRDARFAGLGRLQDVPILGAHLWFDRPVLRESHAALITGPLQWLFRKDASGSSVHGVISAAREWVGKPKEQCLREFEQHVRQVLPMASEARLLRGVVVVEKRATFSPLPGSDRDRPDQAPPPGGIQRLFLAGDYTKSGWPATMEGAVRSGYLAAEAVMKMAGVEKRFLRDDLPPQWPARLMGYA